MLRLRGVLLLYALSIVCFCVLYISFDGRKNNLEVFNLNLNNNGVQVLPKTIPYANITAKKIDPFCSQGIVMYDTYCVLSPYDREMKNTSSVGVVTLCTQGTVEFIEHVIVLCQRWSAPISIAVYSPVEDYEDARLKVHLLRQCDFCVRYWVNWHFFFQNQKMPEVTEFQKNSTCRSITQSHMSQKRRSQGIYPINVGRNVARRLATTPFIFSNDIELYPSLNIPFKFERMLRSQSTSNSSTNQVWVIPVFEVSSKFRAPMTKPTLRNMFIKRQVFSFHQFRCNLCHRIPNLTEWINHKDDALNSELEDFLEPLKIWTTVKRSYKFRLQAWEPFFIGTKNDPEFDIRLSWEGKQNKMQVAYEMCMKDYDFHVIENAFLVHTPGINRYNATKEKARAQYTQHNKQIIKEIKNKLIKKYGTKKNC